VVELSREAERRFSWGIVLDPSGKGHCFLAAATAGDPPIDHPTANNIGSAHPSLLPEWIGHCQSAYRDPQQDHR
jgi:hypothetical protein